MNDVSALIERLLEAPRDCAVENCGLTGVVEAISGAGVTAVTHRRGPRPLTQRERQLLQALGATTGHERSGILCTGTVPVAATTAILLPYRIPAAARHSLGIGPGATAHAADAMPLGHVLAGLDVWCEPLEVRSTPGQRDASGREHVICSRARLWLGGPIAIITERVFMDFLTAYPAPWTAR